MASVTWSLADATTASLVGGNFAAGSNGDPYNNFIDDSDSSGAEDWYSVGARLLGGAFSGTVSSAQLTLQRIGDNQGTNGLIRIRAEASNTPAAFTSGSPPKSRTLRTTYVDYTFPADGNAVTIDVTSIFQDLASIYTYSGTEAVVLVFGAQQKFGLGNAVVWRNIAARYGSTTNAQVAITYSSSAAGSEIEVIKSLEWSRRQVHCGRRGRKRR